MAFTGQLGSAASTPGNIELGAAGGGPAPPAAPVVGYTADEAAALVRRRRARRRRRRLGAARESIGDDLLTGFPGHIDVLLGSEMSAGHWTGGF